MRWIHRLRLHWKAFKYNHFRKEGQFHLIPDNEISHSSILKRHCGERKPKGAIPIFSPFEMGYECPICGIGGDLLHWSEYNYTLYCENCNVDIPSVCCYPVRIRRQALESQKWWVELLKDIKDHTRQEIKLLQEQWGQNAKG